MKKHLKTVLFGFLTWLVPFIFSFFFFTPNGELTIDKFLFKSIMIVIGALTAVYLLVRIFKDITQDHVRQGVNIGLIWLAVNWILDFGILLPMSGMSFENYFMEIGLRYLVIPIMAIGMGRALANKHQIHD